MNNCDRNFQRAILISDKNFNSLWEQLHNVHPANYTSSVKTQAAMFMNYHSDDCEIDGDFMEVWMRIEGSIKDFENTKTNKKNEEHSDINRSKTNLNFEL